MKRSLIIFAREPERGKVKTRLKGPLNQTELLSLYKAFLKDTIEMAKGVDCEERILAYTSQRKPQYLMGVGQGFKFYRQRGRSLGERIHNAFIYAKGNKATKLAIIGTDSPDLPSRLIEEAFLKLNLYDVILGPSRDGGYYLIALKKPCPALFKDIQWGSDEVLKKTLMLAKKYKKKVAMLKKWYDVDNLDTLAELIQGLKGKQDTNIAVWTRRFLERPGMRNLVRNVLRQTEGLHSSICDGPGALFAAGNNPVTL